MSVKSQHKKSAQSPSLIHSFHPPQKFLDYTNIILWVHHALYYKLNTGLPNLSNNGVCSKLLCDTMTYFTNVSVSVPVVKTMLLPPNADINFIMIRTGTVISPICNLCRINCHFLRQPFSFIVLVVLLALVVPSTLVRPAGRGEVCFQIWHFQSYE